MKKLSVLIANKHTTSVSIEEEFLSALKQIAQNKNMSINQLITHIDEQKEVENLSSAIRIFILKELTPSRHCEEPTGDVAISANKKELKDEQN